MVIETQPKDLSGETLAQSPTQGSDLSVSLPRPTTQDAAAYNAPVSESSQIPSTQVITTLSNQHPIPPGMLLARAQGDIYHETVQLLEKLLDKTAIEQSQEKVANMLQSRRDFDSSVVLKIPATENNLEFIIVLPNDGEDKIFIYPKVPNQDYIKACYVITRDGADLISCDFQYDGNALITSSMLSPKPHKRWARLVAGAMSTSLNLSNNEEDLSWLIENRLPASSAFLSSGHEQLSPRQKQILITTLENAIDAID